MVLADLYLPRRESFSVLNFNKLDHVVELVKTQYVDDVNTDSLQDIAIKSFLEVLDPHSVYMTKEEIAKENENLQGNFDGIGVQFRDRKSVV